jgi:hypothetical protein
MYRVKADLHAYDGVDEKEHGNQQAHVWQGLQIFNNF